MLNSLEKRFEELKDKIVKSGFNPSIVERAYKTAAALHENQFRKDGSPYISHPLEVAHILQDLNMDSDVICAALLHDTVEDCGYTIAKLRQNFNANIAQLVDIVSEIDIKKYKYDSDEIFEDKNFVKFSALEQTFKKLIKIGKNNPLGFCIKFADRLHNLKTIYVFELNKQLEKVKETQRWILPLAELLHAEYFYREIKNECFKITHQENSGFLQQYKFYHNTNKKNFENFISEFKNTYSDSGFLEIIGKDITEYKVYESLNEELNNLNFSQISQGQILRVPNYNLYLIYDNGTQVSAITNFFNGYNKNLFKHAKIVDAQIGKFTSKAYFILQDNIKNLYNVTLLKKSDYIVQMVGTLDGQAMDFLEEDDSYDFAAEFIKVKTRSEEIKYIQKDSTVLDFAFKIHKDIGLGFQYAIINDSKTKFPPHTKLNENDKIEIIVKRNKYGEITINAEIKWMAYVNTNLAKKVLIKHFEKS